MKVLSTELLTTYGIPADRVPSTRYAEVAPDVAVIPRPITAATGYAGKLPITLGDELPTVGSCPRIPQLRELAPGWNHFAAGEWMPVPELPAGRWLFDTETFGRYRQYPNLAVAMNGGHTYLWLSPWWKGEGFKEELVPIQNSLLIAYNAPFDRGRVEESYKWNDTNWWLDLYSVAVAGLGLQESLAFWVERLLGLKMPKESRSFFAEANPHDPKCLPLLVENWSELCSYAINDVWLMARAAGKMWAEYRYRSHPVTLAGHLLLHRGLMPFTDNWDAWLQKTDVEFEETGEYLREVEARLLEEVTEDLVPFLEWRRFQRGRNKGKAKWQVDFRVGSEAFVKCLRLRLRGETLELHKGVDPDTGKRFKEWRSASHTLPHPLGERCGNPLADYCSHLFESGAITSDWDWIDLPRLQAAITAQSYWTSVRRRAGDLCPKETDRGTVVVPSMNPHGTVSRRCVDRLWLVVGEKSRKVGSTLKHQIRVKPEHGCLIGADFASQEMSIAALLSDSPYGGTPGFCTNVFSQRVFAGAKSERTDPHTAIADEFGISRSDAKVINFAGIYGAGAKRIATSLGVSRGTAWREQFDLASRIVTSKRGWRERGGGEYFGGTDSRFFNSILQWQSQSCQTPLLQTKLPKFLTESFKRGESFTTMANYPIQSTGVDLLHMFVTLMAEHAAHLDHRLVIARHDEVWFWMSNPADAEEFARIMNSCHAAVWIALAVRLRVFQFPAHLSVFEDIQVDWVLRKAPDADVTDGVNPELPHGYSVKPSEGLL